MGHLRAGRRTGRARRVILAYVALELVLSRKVLAAVAGEGSLAGVAATVARQVGGAGEARGAVLAHVLPLELLVQQPVLQQVVAAARLVVADGADQLRRAGRRRLVVVRAARLVVVDGSFEMGQLLESIVS